MHGANERFAGEMEPMEMSLAKKLNFKEGMKSRVIDKPKNVDLLDLAITKAEQADGVILFVKNLAEVNEKIAPVFEASKSDRLAWVAYPKVGQLDTDLNRDILWQHLIDKGLRGVRQVSIDEIWSAIRFRKA